MNDCGVRHLSGRNRGHVQFILYIIQFGNDESVNSLFTGTFRLLDNACILFGEQRYGTECFYQIIVSHCPEKAGLYGQRSIIASCNIRCATVQQDVTFLHNLIEYFPIIAYNRSGGVESLVIAVKHTFGGTVGDIESQPFLEAIRQFQHEVGHENAILIHVTLIPYIKASGELKTKPTQASVKELQGMGIQPDIIVCRSEHELDQSLKDKIALFCNVPNGNVLQNLDVEYLYEAPLAMEKENLAKVACKALHLDCPEPDLKDWEAMVDSLRHPNKEVKIALVGKYIALHDAYISVVEALKHGGIAERATVDLHWIDSETLNDDNAKELLGDMAGIIVPGGFGSRGVEGMISAAKYARENNVPYLGLCLGMQVAIIEFARHVCGFHDAHSVELDPNTTHPVIALMPDQNGVEDIGGTLRLGSYPCVLDPTSKARELYGSEEIHERHRHRYEVNNDFRAALTEGGMKLCGTSPDGRIVEMIEIPDHPWFLATQAHPEFKSRPNRPHPLFKGFVEAAVKNSMK